MAVTNRFNIQKLKCNHMARDVLHILQFFTILLHKLTLSVCVLFIIFMLKLFSELVTYAPNFF